MLSTMVVAQKRPIKAIIIQVKICLARHIGWIVSWRTKADLLLKVLVLEAISNSMQAISRKQPLSLIFMVVKKIFRPQEEKRGLVVILSILIIILIQMRLKMEEWAMLPLALGLDQKLNQHKKIYLPNILEELWIAQMMCVILILGIPNMCLEFSQLVVLQLWLAKIWEANMRKALNNCEKAIALTR